MCSSDLSSWSFKNVITGLYDQFIHDNATNDATEKFWRAEYNAKEGVMSFYHKLERYAARMICAPDRFTFKPQLLAGLPTSITSFILERGCSAETSTTDTLLHYACSAETVERTKKRLKESRRTVDLSRSKAPPSSSKPTKVKEPSPTRSHERSRDRSDRCDRFRYRDQSRRYPRGGEEGPRQNRDWREEKKDSRSTPSGSRPSKVENNRASDRKSGDTKGPTCYSCGGPHYSMDKKCPDYGKPKPATRMYAARESSAKEAEEDQGHHPVAPRDDASKGEERLAVVHSDSVMITKSV